MASKEHLDKVADVVAMFLCAFVLIELAVLAAQYHHYWVTLTLTVLSLVVAFSAFHKIGH